MKLLFSAFFLGLGITLITGISDNQPNVQVILNEPNVKGFTLDQPMNLEKIALTADNSDGERHVEVIRDQSENGQVKSKTLQPKQAAASSGDKMDKFKEDLMEQLQLQSS